VRRQWRGLEESAGGFRCLQVAVVVQVQRHRSGSGGRSSPSWVLR
jgi:hypothetical protein